MRNRRAWPGRLGHDTARPRPRHGVVRPRYRPRHSRPAREACSSAHGLARGSRDTKHCIVAEGRPLCRHMAQKGCDTLLLYGRAHARYDAQGPWHELLHHDTILYRDRGAATRPGTGEIRSRGGPRHDLACGLGVVHAQPGPRVGALCTRLSFDSVHCSESLFVNTVHEHCSRGFKKKKSNKMK